MKKLIITISLAMFIGPSANAQSYDPDFGGGNATVPVNWQSGYFAHLSLAQVYPRAVAYESPVRNYVRSANVVGADPDPNIQFQLLRESEHLY